MICYRDKTWCTWYKDCADRQMCDRVLTPEERAKAESLNLPISQFMAPPKCHTEWKDREDLHDG